MKKSNPSFRDDLKELTSPSNFIVGLVTPVVIGVILNQEKKIITALTVTSTMLGLIILYFFFRWIIYYRSESEEKKKSQKNGNKPRVINTKTTIQEDALFILDTIYSLYANDQSIQATTLINHFKDWEGKRINKALRFLNDEGYIDLKFMLGNTKGVQNFLFKKITNEGIKLIEK
ncbi:hypothetical protein JXA12_04375 [Candidatus Woesearchaeota archaeon]|nr:hypothetical protein [Candidatus Woesearchaeota archaeon]